MGIFFFIVESVAISSHLFPYILMNFSKILKEKEKENRRFWKFQCLLEDSYSINWWVNLVDRDWEFWNWERISIFISISKKIIFLPWWENHHQLQENFYFIFKKDKSILSPTRNSWTMGIFSFIMESSFLLARLNSRYILVDSVKFLKRKKNKIVCFGNFDASSKMS